MSSHQPPAHLLPCLQSVFVVHLSGLTAILLLLLEHALINSAYVSKTRVKKTGLFLIKYASLLKNKLRMTKNLFTVYYYIPF